ncbi:MAG: MoaD/ThiS family protein [Acidimicrobiia bacterium]
MTSRVLLPAVLRPHADGNLVVEATGETLGEIISDVGRRYPNLGEQLLTDDGELPTFVNVFVGDEDVRYLEGLATEVEEGSEITILPAVAGG